MKNNTQLTGPPEVIIVTGWSKRGENKMKNEKYKNLANELRNLETIKENLSHAEKAKDAKFYTQMFNFYIRTLQNVRRIKSEIYRGQTI